MRILIALKQESGSQRPGKELEIFLQRWVPFSEGKGK